MNYKSSYKILWAGIIVGFLIGFFSLLLGFIVMAVSIIQARIFYRCPKCDSSLLSVRGRMPDYCPYCSEPLF